MNKEKMVSASLFCLIFVASNYFTFGAVTKGSNDIEWTSSIKTEGGVVVSWFMQDPEWITMEMEAPTTGYVAVGFSPVTGMVNADIVLGYVDSNGEGHLVDLHARGNEMPLLDDSQDYELLSSIEINGKTTIRFRRKWDTCDEHQDYQINDNTVKLIWAYHEKDPDEQGPKFSASYHEMNRGIKNVYLRIQPKHEPFPDETGQLSQNVKYLDFTASDTQVNGTATTTYTCEIMKFPEFDKKHHMIGWRPIIQAENMKRVHHLFIYECVPPFGQDSYAMYEQHVGRVEPCYAPNMPPSWTQNCWNTLMLWTLGSDGDMYPPHVGVPIGQKFGGATYYMLESHYDNPEKLDFKDSSGIRIFYTDEPREHDLGILWIGSRISGFQFVPPGAKDFTSVAACTPECTSQAIPKEGIFARQLILHSHKAARRVGLKHIRRGQELAPIGEDNHYDNYYQQPRNLEPEARILPGDSLITFCEYETLDKKAPLYGGAETNDTEMCITFLQYYPRIPLASCEFQPEFHGFLNTLGVKKVTGDVLELLQLPYKPKPGQLLDPAEESMVLANYSLSGNPFEQMTVVEPIEHKGKTVANVIDETDFDKRLVKEMTKVFGPRGRHYAFCTQSGRVRVPLSNYITSIEKYREYKRPENKACSNRAKARTSGRKNTG